MEAFAQQRTADRAHRLGLCQLACVGRHTITGLLYTSGSDYGFSNGGGPNANNPGMTQLVG